MCRKRGEVPLTLPDTGDSPEQPVQGLDHGADLKGGRGIRQGAQIIGVAIAERLSYFTDGLHTPTDAVPDQCCENRDDGRRGQQKACHNIAYQAVPNSKIVSYQHADTKGLILDGVDPPNLPIDGFFSKAAGMISKASHWRTVRVCQESAAERPDLAGQLAVDRGMLSDVQCSSGTRCGRGSNVKRDLSAGYQRVDHPSRFHEPAVKYPLYFRMCSPINPADS